MIRKKYFLYIAILAAVLAFGVVMLGAYVRLSQAGLGCPDWPGCYGHVSVPTEAEVNSTLLAARPLEPARAWKEMIHRYFVGGLSTLIFALAVLAVWRRKQADQPKLLPALLVVLLILQALLGMWTVTLLLFPPVVTAHLLGGLATLSLLALLVLQSGAYLRLGAAATPRIRLFAAIGLAVLICQIALGGWTSANYAALACGFDFPQCMNQWWPPTDFHEGFVLWRGVGVNYEGGVLDASARAAIQIAHRIGAVVVFCYLAWLAFRLSRVGSRGLAIAIGVLLLAQVSLGIGNVKLGLPLPVATAHNGVAALLLFALIVTLVRVTTPAHD